MQGDVTVTAADREAYLALNMLPEKYADAVRAGEWDSVTGMQVLARHRLAALADAQGEPVAAQDVAALVEALRFYADREQYRYDRIGQHLPIENDCGDVARAALAKHERTPHDRPTPD